MKKFYTTMLILSVISSARHSFSSENKRDESESPFIEMAERNHSIQKKEMPLPLRVLTKGSICCCCSALIMTPFAFFALVITYALEQPDYCSTKAVDIAYPFDPTMIWQANVKNCNGHSCFLPCNIPIPNITNFTQLEEYAHNVSLAQCGSNACSSIAMTTQKDHGKLVFREEFQEKLQWCAQGHNSLQATDTSPPAQEKPRRLSMQSKMKNFTAEFKANNASKSSPRFNRSSVIFNQTKHKMGKR